MLPSPMKGMAEPPMDPLMQSPAKNAPDNEQEEVGNVATDSLAGIGFSKQRFLALSYQKFGILCCFVALAAVMTAVIHSVVKSSPPRNNISEVVSYATSSEGKSKTVAFIGNSMMYFYDLPRSLEIVSDGRVRQNSILAGAGSLSNMIEKQNGMWNRWRTDENVVYKLNVTTANETDQDFVDDTVWDFGACTIDMLLFGFDAEEAQATYDAYGPDSDDTSNACTQSQAYLDYLNDLPDSDIRKSPPEQWDFIVLNDQTKNPTKNETRHESLSALEMIYLPLFNETGATPLFLVTPAYWTKRDEDHEGNTNSFDNIPYWTVQTYEGYKQYAEYLAGILPSQQEPKLVNMATAFLVVYEEQTRLWIDLFYADGKHLSPHGSFLQSCLLHHAVYDFLPREKSVVRDNMSTLWDGTRTLRAPRDIPMRYPTKEEAEYLYDVCERVADGYIPPLMEEQMEALNLTLYESKK